MAEPSPPKPGLIDTDILVDALRGHPPACKFTSDCANSPFGITVSSITAMELITGCSNLTELRRLDAVFESFRTIHISEEASRQALHWMKAYRLSHGLTIPDALIAATAQISGLSLYTKNTKHFQMIPLLQIIRPY